MSQGSTDLIRNPNVFNDALKHYAKRLASFDNDKEIQTILPDWSRLIQNFSVHLIVSDSKSRV